MGSVNLARCGNRCRLPIVVMTLAVLSWCGSASRAQSPPNIVLIFADDQCFETIRAFGNDEIETPNLDRLVRRGTTFTHCYNQGSWSGAVCVASRTMLMTGRYLWHANQVYQTSEAERQAGRFWPEYMRGAGYDTYFTGKWHVRAKAEKAFDVVAHVRGGMPNQTPQGYNRPLADQPDVWKPWDPQFDGFWKGGKHWSEVVADDAESFLARAAERDNPFFMYLAFNAPHDPRQSPREYVDKYPLEKVSVPKNFLPEYPYKDDIGCSSSLRDEKLAPFPRTPHAIQVHRQEYYAIITHMDAQIGRILDALEKTGKSEQTYIFFSADHGLAVGHHGLVGKQNLYDHSVRVPFIACGPKFPTDRRVDTPIYLQDVMATSLELAKVEKPEHVEFHSILPLVDGSQPGAYDAIYGGYLELQRMVTWEGYKLLLYPKAQQYRLYHLESDPDEMVDLSDQAKHLATARRLFARFQALQSDVGDELDLSQVFPQLAN